MRRPILLATAVLVVAVALPANSAAADLPTWPVNPNWHGLVPALSSGNVRPVSVVRTHGTVSNPGALTGQSSGSTTLTVPSGGSPAIDVLDFGKAFFSESEHFSRT